MGIERDNKKIRVEEISELGKTMADVTLVGMDAITGIQKRALRTFLPYIIGAGVAVVLVIVGLILLIAAVF